jgi:Lrp/AsnC family leucine-responsive transcriptional regulator
VAKFRVFCLKRRLEEEGFIPGYVALLNPDHLGDRLLALVGVPLDRRAPDVFHDFRADIEPMEEVVECHMVAGAFDYVIKVRVPDMQAYSKFLSKRLAALPGVAQMSTFVALDEVRWTLRF